MATRDSEGAAETDAPCFRRTLHHASYLAFGGCGLKGVAYLGVLKCLQRHHPDFADWHATRLRGCVGSSSGCIAALAFLVNVDADEIIAAWRALQIENVAPALMDINAVFQRLGADAGQNLRRVIDAALGVCGLAPTTTFRALHRLTGRELRVCATNLNRLCLQVFSHTQTPDLAVADAIYYSMTVPFVFQPKKHAGDVMVDGCLFAFVPYEVSGWPTERTVSFFVAGTHQTAAADHNALDNEGRLASTANARVEVNDLSAFATNVLRCCTKSMLTKVNALADAQPWRYVRVIVDAEDDGRLECGGNVMLRMQRATFDAIVHAGFCAALVRTMPHVMLVLRALVFHSAQQQSSKCQWDAPP